MFNWHTQYLDYLRKKNNNELDCSSNSLSKIDGLSEMPEPEFKSMGQMLFLRNTRKLYNDEDITEMEKELNEVNSRICRLQDELGELNAKSNRLAMELSFRRNLEDLIEFEKQGFTLETLLNNNGYFGVVKMKQDRERALKICEKLKKNDLIRGIDNREYSVEFFINTDKTYHVSDSYEVKKKIIKNFEDLGYFVECPDNWRLKIIIEDIDKIIDDCFSISNR